MPDSSVLEESPPQFRFSNPELAKQGGIASAITRKLQAQKAKAFDALSLEVIPAVQQGLEHAQSLQLAHAGALEMLAAHIARIDDKLSHAETPADFRDLAQARSKLFEQWAHLAGIPKPMAAREVRTTRRTYAPPAAPVEIPAIPQP